MYRPGHLKTRSQRVFKVKKSRVGYTYPTIIGYDTETCEGPPISIQFYSDQMPSINTCLFVTQDNILDKTLRYLKRKCKGGQYVIYGHNLRFDLVSLFYKDSHKLVQKKDGFEFTHRDWHISGVYGNPTFCVLRNKTTEIHIVDSFSWFSTSLANLSALICPDLPKLTKPDRLGTKVFDASDKEFIAYAMRDAEIAYYAGVWIENMAQEFELGPCPTVASMAAAIFRQHYISESAPIWNTQRFMNKGAVSSYHGGKNNVMPGMAPAWHYHVDAWDLSSAYPHAMTLLPAMSRPELYVGDRIFNKRQSQFPDHGVYCISGYAKPCNWPIVSDEKFKYIRGQFEDVWITGYELNEARRLGEIRLSRVWGHYYDTEKDPVTSTAFMRYVNDFYQRKQDAEDPIYRYLYKVLLNSLYGKFIQSREVETANGDVRWKHGPLYHPFAASLITGHTRAVMHRLEHEVEAIHTATDGVFCGVNNSPANGKFSWAPQEGLGSIESEGRDMTLCMMRNKLYILYAKSGKYPSEIRPGEYIHKMAKHGFQGSVGDLERCAQSGNRQYTRHGPNTLKMALKQQRVPNKFEDRTMSLNVDPIRDHFNHDSESEKEIP